MASPESFVEFRQARTPFEAKVIAAVLQDAEIPVLVPGGGMLADEFAVSQRLMNQQGVSVRVPADRVADAEAALAAAKRSGEQLAAELGDEPLAAEEAATAGASASERGGVRPWGWTLALAGVALVFATLWAKSETALAHATRFPLWETRSVETGSLSEWTHNGAIAYEMVDVDRDGIIERQHSHDRQGNLRFTAFDEDENGIYERFTAYALSGAEAAHWFDRDQNGIMDELVELRGAERAAMIDADQDGLIDRIEVRSDQGAVLATQEYRPGVGYVNSR